MRRCRDRSVDFADAERSIRAVDHITIPDERFDYGEPRFQTLVSCWADMVMVRVNAARIGAARHFDEEVQ